MAQHSAPSTCDPKPSGTVRQFPIFFVVESLSRTATECEACQRWQALTVEWTQAFEPPAQSDPFGGAQLTLLFLLLPLTIHRTIHMAAHIWSVEVC